MFKHFLTDGKNTIEVEFSARDNIYFGLVRVNGVIIFTQTEHNYIDQAGIWFLSDLLDSAQRMARAMNNKYMARNLPF